MYIHHVYSLNSFFFFFPFLFAFCWWCWSMSFSDVALTAAPRALAGGSSSRVSVYSRMFLQTVCALYYALMFAYLLVVSWRSKIELGYWLRIMNESIAPVFSCIKLKNLALQFKKLWPQLWLATQPASQGGPALSIGFQFCFGGARVGTFLFTEYFFCFLRKMFTLPSF